MLVCGVLLVSYVRIRVSTSDLQNSLDYLRKCILSLRMNLSSDHSMEGKPPFSVPFTLTKLHLEFQEIMMHFIAFHVIRQRLVGILSSFLPAILTDSLLLFQYQCTCCATTSGESFLPLLWWKVTS